MESDERIQFAIEHTEIVRRPKQKLATFGTTNVYYYLISELMDRVNVVREGRVIAAKPKIVTPTYLINLEGFSAEATRFFELLAGKYPNESGIFYSYRNDPLEMNIVSEPTDTVIDNINHIIDQQENPLTAIIKGIDEMWDVSLLKFTFDLTRSSLYRNVTEMDSKGLLRMDESGIPEDARRNIEALFEKTRRDSSYADTLLTELKRWNLFDEYEDRFLSLFKK
jgi:hypothetical protein